MKLWCFLHAFQLSPYRYLYLSDVLRALQSLQNETELFRYENFLETLSGLNPDSSLWWKSLLEKADLIQKEELKHFNPELFKFTFYGDSHFPKTLIHSSNPPLALSYQGDLEAFEKNCLSAVGSREPHEFTRQWMQKEFYEFLKHKRIPVVSGGARGVDQMAHKIALILGLPTAVVLPSGLAKKYPALWGEDGWCEKGVTFISEMRLGAHISKQNFSSRNRLIASYGALNLILEAREKSGTLITAHHALMESKPVCVIPAHPCLSQFSGSLQLLTEGACFVRNASDLSFYFEGELQGATGVFL